MIKKKRHIDSMELSEETKRDIEDARKEIREGKTVSLEEVKKKLGFKD